MRTAVSRRLAAAVRLAGLLAVLGCGDGPTPPGAGPAGRLLLTTYRGPYGGRPSIAVVRPDGRDRRELTAPGRAERDASWSPDGRRIAFVRLDSTESGVPDTWPHLYVMDADGSNVRQLTFWYNRAESPRWSPDGSRLVYWGYDGFELPPGMGRLYVVRSDGSEGSDPHQITTATSWSPDWSPDGSRILFRAFRAPRGAVELFVVRPDGSDEAPLSVDGRALCAGDVGAARWSPDGARIAYVCQASDGPALYVVAADGTNPVRLGGPGTPAPTDGGADGAVWSPDGQWLAFTRDVPDGGWDVYLARAAGATAAGARGPVVREPEYVRVTSWGGPP